jgi:hypothetical protein
LAPEEVSIPALPADSGWDHRNSETAPVSSTFHTSSLEPAIDDIVIPALDCGILWQEMTLDVDWSSWDIPSQVVPSELGTSNIHSSVITLQCQDWVLEKIIRQYVRQIHPSTPFFSESFVLDGFACGRHNTSREFGAMVLALCAFTLTQFHGSSHSICNEGIPTPTEFLNEATRLHSVSNLGEEPTIEALLADIFMFGSLWSTKRQSAAWLRLQEALNLARLLHLPNLEKNNSLDSGDWENRARAYLGLVVIERYLPLIG